MAGDTVVLVNDSFDVHAKLRAIAAAGKAVAVQLQIRKQLHALSVAAPAVTERAVLEEQALPAIGVAQANHRCVAGNGFVAGRRAIGARGRNHQRRHEDHDR